MPITVSYIIDSLAELGFTDCKTIHIPKISDAYILQRLPSNWISVFTEAQDLRDFIDDIWMPIKSKLPKTVNLLKEKVQQVAVTPDLKPEEFSLLYIFSENGALRVRAGFQQTTNLPRVFDSLNIDLSPLYKTHNGFVDLISYDAGFLPLDAVEIFTDPESGVNSFLKVFSMGANTFGFDLDSDEKESYIIWGSEGEVEFVQDFWEELDEWIASDIEDFDSATTD
ncbi:MAG: hypothetical protein ABFS39_07155 [Pseudomonadota bacterium]